MHRVSPPDRVATVCAHEPRRGDQEAPQRRAAKALEARGNLKSSIPSTRAASLLTAPEIGNASPAAPAVAPPPAAAASAPPAAEVGDVAAPPDVLSTAEVDDAVAPPDLPPESEVDDAITLAEPDA